MLAIRQHRGIVPGLALGLATLVWSPGAGAALIVGQKSDAFIPTHATVTVFERDDGTTVRWSTSYRGEPQSVLVVLPLADCATTARFETGHEGLISHLAALSGPLADTGCDPPADSDALRPESAGAVRPEPRPPFPGGAAYSPSLQARIPAGQWRDGLGLAREWGFSVDRDFRSALDDTRQAACSLLFYVIEVDGEDRERDQPLPTVILESSRGPALFPSAPVNPGAPTRVLQLVFALSRSPGGGQRAIAELDNYALATSVDLASSSPAKIAGLHAERVNRFFAEHPVAALTEFASNPSARALADGSAATCSAGESNYAALRLTPGELLQLGSRDDALDSPGATPVLTRILAASDPRRTPMLTLAPTSSVSGGFHDQPTALSEATDPFYQVHYRFEGPACVGLTICEPTSALPLDRGGPLESRGAEPLLIRPASVMDPRPVRPSAAACAVDDGQPSSIVWMLFLLICGRRPAKSHRTAPADACASAGTATQPTRARRAPRRSQTS